MWNEGIREDVILTEKTNVMKYVPMNVFRQLSLVSDACNFVCEPVLKCYNTFIDARFSFYDEMHKRNKFDHAK